LSRSSIARKASAIRQLYKYLCLEHGLGSNPAERIEAAAPSRALPKAISREDIGRLLAAADESNPRDRAMVYLMYATGLRVSELVGLSLHDLDLAQEYVRVKGKGDKERIAPFVPIAGELLAAYLNDHRPALAQRSSEKCDFVFLNPSGRGLSRQSFWKTLKALALQAGIATPLSPTNQDKQTGNSNDSSRNQQYRAASEQGDRPRYNERTSQHEDRPGSSKQQAADQ
jgi:integrase/recombinase XerD